uniref:Dynein light intermediate chain n=1 Tax=Acrobeloides nanus TaxID=290746 RepID=A0A914D635_9BILA
MAMITSDEENIWTRILSEVSAKISSTVQGSVIVLGDELSGKTSLVNRLCKDDRSHNNSALEYNFMNIQVDYRDGSYAYQLASAATAFGPSDSMNLPVWILDPKKEFAPLLRFAFPSQLSKCCIVLCASLTQPGHILPSLNKLYSIVSEQIKAFYDPKAIDEAKRAQIRFWQEYVEPIESSMHTDNTSNLEIDNVLLPPEPNILVENCGAPVIVVITKSDLHSELSDEQLNKVQYHVRRFCLQHGAALVYTSAKDEKNIQLLYKYLGHRVYSLPFTSPAYIVEKDSVFVPTGWDSEQKLGIIKETLTDLDVPLLPQEERARHKEALIEAEDEQSFLQKLATTSVDIGASPKRDSPATAKLGAMGQPTDPGNGSLASFFSNLIKSKDGKVQSAAPVDPGAHFQKILAGGKQGGENSSAANSPRPSTGTESLNLDADESLPSTARSTEGEEEIDNEQKAA